MKRILVCALFVVFCVWATVAISADITEEIQALIDKGASGQQLTEAEKEMLNDYLMVEQPERVLIGGMDTQWGPDGWGYEAKDAASGGPAFNWYPNQTGVTPELWLGQNADDLLSGPITLPFTFPYYGANFNTIYVSANVIIQFTTDVIPYYSTGVPSASYTYRIDPYVYDMYHVQNVSRYFYQSFGSVFVITFEEARYFNSTYRNDPNYGKWIQVLLYPDGRITLQYLYLELSAPGSPFNSGIDDNYGPYGLTCGASFTNGQAITFYPPPVIALSNPDIAPSFGTVTDSFSYSVTYRDIGNLAPTIKDVYIDGTPYTMNDPGGSYQAPAGVVMDYGPVSLDQGIHDYYFYFSDGTNTVRLPTSGTYSGPIVTGELQTVSYLQDFDTDDGGFVTTDPAYWEWGDPTAGPPSSYSEPNCWGTNLEGNYSDNACWQLYSVPVALDSNSKLIFNHWYNIEGYFDGGNVKISNDNGASWTLITPEGGYPEVSVYSGNACIPSQPAYSVNSGGWIPAVFDLSTFGTDTVLFKWEFGTDGSVTRTGWYIDDVLVTAEEYVVELTPETQTTYALPQDTVDYTVYISNHGGESDVYDLSATITGGEPWITEIWDNGLTSQIDSIVVGYNATDSVIVRVVIPDTAFINESSTAQIIAHSRNELLRNIYADTCDVTTGVGIGGSYDVGGGNNDYPDLLSAAAVLNAGVLVAPTTYNVYSGNYHGRVEIPYTIAGMGSANPIVFQNAPGEHPIVTSPDYGFYLNGTDYVTIQGFEITDCNNGGIRTISNYDAVSNINVIGNYIHDVGVIYSNPAIDLYEATNCRISGNEISDVMMGIDITVGSGHQVDNNIIYNTSDYGIFHYFCDNSDYVYNTVYTSGTYAFYRLLGENTLVKNNIFYQAGSGYAYYVEGLPYYSLISDYNNIYAPNGYVGQIYNYPTYINLHTLADFQAYTNTDSNSISADPMFVSLDPPDLHITPHAISPVDGAGTPIAGITMDFDGEDRDSLSPDIGADECTRESHDYCIFLHPENQIDLASAGDIYVHRIFIENCGTGHDIFDLLVSTTGATWTHEIWDKTETYVISTIAMNPGALDTFLIKVYTDPAAMLGDEAVCEILAESRSNPRNIYSDTCWVTTEISREVPINWVEIAGPAGGPGTNTGIAYNPAPSTLGPVPLGFTFPYYDCELHPQIWIHSNGTITLEEHFSYSNYPIPLVSDPNNIIAPRWDYYRFYHGGSVWYYPDTTNNRFIVEWYQMKGWSGYGNCTFELILYPDGTIDFMYATIAPYQPFTATVGIENATGTDGIQFTHNGSGPIEPSDSMGIHIEPQCLPENYAVDLRPETLQEWVSVGLYQNYLFTIINFGGEDDVYDLTVDITGQPWTHQIWNKQLTAQIDSIEVNHFAIDTFYIRAYVPQTATVGEISTAEIVASSRTGGTRNILSDTSWATTTAIPMLSMPYSQDFNTNDGYYRPYPLTGGWEWGEPTYGSVYVHSPPYCWGTVLAGEYDIDACYHLTSPSIILDSMATLSFYAWYNIENYYDGGNMKISTDGGANWTLITPEGGYPEDAVSSYNACIPGEPAFSGFSGDGYRPTFDLSAFAGDTVKFRWDFGSDGSVTYEGLYFDDVEIAVILPGTVDDLLITLSSGTDDSTNITLLWSPTENAQQYHIYKSTTAPDSGFALLGSTTDTTYVDTDAIILESTSFYYVTADNELLDSGVARSISPFRVSHPVIQRQTFTKNPTLQINAPAGNKKRR